MPRARWPALCATLLLSSRALAQQASGDDVATAQALFDDARRLIADLTGESGFPPFMLEPLDFAGIYASRRAAAQGQPIGQA